MWCGKAGRSQRSDFSARPPPSVGLASVPKPELLRELGKHVAKRNLPTAEGIHDGTTRKRPLEVDMPGPLDDLAGRTTHGTANRREHLDDLVILVDHDLVHVLGDVEREPQLQSAGLTFAMSDAAATGELA